MSQQSPNWKTIANELANETDPQKALALSLEPERAFDANKGQDEEVWYDVRRDCRRLFQMTRPKSRYGLLEGPPRSLWSSNSVETDFQ
jgi:hypothetical protein